MPDMENKAPVNVLLVDDQPAKLLSYEVMLAELGESLVPVASAREALEFLLKFEVAVILIDVCMPELDGFELAKMIRQHPRFQKTAIIFVSAVHMEESDYLRGYEAGAVEYLSVPVVPQLLRAKVRIFAELFRKTKQLQQLNDELEKRVAERTAALEHAADRLRKSERGRTLALAAGNMGSWDYHVPSGEWFWDEGQSHIFGVEHASFIPTEEKVRQAIHADDLQRVRDKIAGLKPGEENLNLEVRIVQPSGDVRWCHVAAVASLNVGGNLERLSGVTTDITFRKSAEERQTLLAREVDHRAKNALAVVQAIVRLARRETIEEYVASVEGRIGALAKTHELLSNARWEGADLLHLILEELAPYNEGGQRVTAIGPTVRVSAEDAQILAVALHELATNAAKYGALSTLAGRIDLSWSHFEGKLTLVWAESGGAPVTPPARKGFGTKIISSSFNGEGKGGAQFDWRPDGLRCTLELHCLVKPVLNQGYVAPSEPRLVAPPDVSRAPSGKTRLLLVEDEAIVGMFMEELLEELGFAHTPPITNLPEALACVKRERYDGAILDMNLKGESVYPLADLLQTQNVPFVFVTGYSQSGIDKRFSGVPIVQKPVTADSLAQVLFARFGRYVGAAEVVAEAAAP